VQPGAFCDGTCQNAIPEVYFLEGRQIQNSVLDLFSLAMVYLTPTTTTTTMTKILVTLCVLEPIF
jgi:hypothetical protein